MGKKEGRQKKHADHADTTDALLKAPGSSFYNKIIIHLSVIILLGVFAYSNTFSVPFQWDEGFFLKDNPIVKDIGYFIDSSKAAGLGREYADRALHLRSRYVPYLTFALNYRLHGNDVPGYHLINFGIHILNALLVYALVILTFKTSFLKNIKLKIIPEAIAFFSGVVFAVHPVQTEAVTYIYQRLASLVSLFYLLAIVSYIRSRLSDISREKYIFYAISLASVLLAMKSKENAFTLPFVILLYEIFFFSDTTKNRALRLFPFALTLAIIPLMLIDVQKPLGDIMTDVDAATTRTRAAIPRTVYLFTQFRVIVTYLRLLVFPADQVLDYHYPFSRSLFEPHTMASFLLLGVIGAFGIFFYLKSRRSSPEYRILSFGIFWFFITLSIESSIFPINMVIDEYRVYLPSVGLITAFAVGLAVFWHSITPKVFFIFLATTALALTAVTYQRNTVWQTRVSLWSDVVKKAPLNPRGHLNLATAYMDEGNLKEACDEFLKAVKLNPDHPDAHNSLSFTYRMLGNLDKAIEHGLRAVKLKPDSPRPYNNLGNAYAAKGMYDKAIEHYLVVLRLDPGFSDTYNNLGVAYMSKGMSDMAMTNYRKALELSPDYADAHNNLGNVYMSQKRTAEAAESYLRAIKSEPRHADAHNNLGLVYALSGRMDKAEEHFSVAISIKAAFPDAHLNMGRLYISRKDYAMAEKELLTALRLNPGLLPAQQLLFAIRSREN